MRRSPLLATTMLAGLALAPAAQAQITTVDEDGALQIQTGIKTWITENILAPDLNISIQFDAPITVVPEGDQYRVNIPSNMIGDGWGSGVRIESSEFTLAPTERGWFDTTVRLPDQAVFISEFDGPVAEITLGNQRASGLFVPRMETFLTLDLLVEAIRVAPYDEPGEMTIAEVAMVSEATEDEAGLTTMIFDGSMRDFRLVGAPDVAFSLDEMIFDYEVDGVPLDEFIDFTAELYAIEDDFYEELYSDPFSDTYDSFGALEDFADLIANAPALMSSFVMEFGLRGLSVTPEGMGAPVTLDSTTLRMDASGLDGDVSRVGLLVEMDSLSGAGIPFVGPMLPSYAIFDLEVLGVPNDALVASLVQWLSEMADFGPEQAAEMAFLPLVDAIMQGGSEMRLNTFEVYAESMSVKVDGTLQPDPTGMTPVKFEATVELGGLPAARMALLPWIQDDATSQGFDMLESLGEPVTDDRGQPVLRYELASTPQGGMTINGEDAEALFDALDN